MRTRPHEDIRLAGRDILHACGRIYERGYVASNDGNVSARLTEDRVLITPTGRSKGFLDESDLVLIDLEGRVIGGGGRPSSEAKVHTALYRARPDIHGVVHAHPVTATGFAVAGVPLDAPLLPEILLTLGRIPLVPYGCPGTEELPERILAFADRHDAFLLQNHGVLTVGPDVIEAYHRLESVEHFAQIARVARQLGGERPLSDERVQQLVALRDRYGLGGRNPLTGPKEPHAGP